MITKINSSVNRSQSSSRLTKTPRNVPLMSHLVVYVDIGSSEITVRQREIHYCIFGPHSRWIPTIHFTSWTIGKLILTFWNSLLDPGIFCSFGSSKKGHRHQVTDPQTLYSYGTFIRYGQPHSVFQISILSYLSSRFGSTLIFSGKFTQSFCQSVYTVLRRFFFLFVVFLVSHYN